MLLDTSPLSAPDPARDLPPTTERTGNSRRRGGAAASDSASAYARVRDEVQAGAARMRPAEMPSSGGEKKISLWQSGAFGFGDLIDVINPLQHIPIVATIYRNLSGDQIGIGARVIGGALWGRIGGFVAGIVNSVVEWFTGKDIGDHIYSVIWGKAEGAAVAKAPQPATPGAADAKRETVPVSGGAGKSAVVEPVSGLAPDVLLSRRIENSFYRRDGEGDDKRNHPGAQFPTVHLRA
jgi:hypothetical protein